MKSNKATCSFWKSVDGDPMATHKQDIFMNQLDAAKQHIILNEPWENSSLPVLNMCCLFF